MKVVEVVAGRADRPASPRALAALGARDGPHAGRAGHPGLHRQPRRPRLRHRSPAHRREGVADFATIDRILVGAAGFRLGPFELMDLIGLDVSHAVMESVVPAVLSRSRATALDPAEPLVAAGLLGRKTGAASMRYEGRQARHAPDRPAGYPTAKPPGSAGPQPGAARARSPKPSRAPTSTPASGPRRARPASSCRWARTAPPRHWPKPSIPPARSRWIRCSGCPAGTR